MSMPGTILKTPKDARTSKSTFNLPTSTPKAAMSTEDILKLFSKAERGNRPVVDARRTEKQPDFARRDILCCFTLLFNVVGKLVSIRLSLIRFSFFSQLSFPNP